MEKEILIDFGERLHVLLYTQVPSSAQCVVGLQFVVQMGRFGHPVTLLQQIRQFPPVYPRVRTTAWWNKKKTGKVLINSHEILTSKFTTGIHWTKTKPILTWRTSKGHL